MSSTSLSIISTKEPITNEFISLASCLVGFHDPCIVFVLFIRCYSVPVPNLHFGRRRRTEATTNKSDDWAEQEARRMIEKQRSGINSLLGINNRLFVRPLIGLLCTMDELYRWCTGNMSNGRLVVSNTKRGRHAYTHTDTQARPSLSRHNPFLIVGIAAFY